MDAEFAPADRLPDRYRLLILGGGPAAIYAARAAAARGVRAALVLPETSETRACEPTEFARRVRQAQAHFALAELALAPDEPNVDVYRGRPFFFRRHSVKVGQRELRFRKALIATGARLVGEPIDGAAENDCLRAETLDGLAELPPRLAVIGCDAIACQWAQAFCRFGSQVHLIARRQSILPEEDRDAAAALQSRFAEDGIRLHLGCDEVTIETTGNLRGVVIGHGGRQEKLLVDRVLLGGRRCPNTQGLALETVPVAYDERGIRVDDRLRSCDRHVFAAGAVCGPPLDSPQAARASAEVAVHNALAWTARKLSRLVIPRVIHTHPQLVQLGLIPDETSVDDLEIETYRAELAEADASLPEHYRQGFLAVHVHRRSGNVLGATIVAESADELSAPLALLMSRRLPLSALCDVVPCLPSRIELLRQLAERCRRSR